MTSKFNPENEIIFTIARMNAPTPGHKLLIKTMMIKALELGLSQINIILSATVDNKKNPIECEEKRMILYNYAVPEIQKELVEEFPDNVAQIEEMNVEIICMDDETDSRRGSHPIFSKVNYILFDLYNAERKSVKMYLIIGEDRKDSYNWILEALASRETPIDVEIIGLGRPEGAMSATFLRGLALSGVPEDKELFFEHMRELGMPDFEIDSVYQQIKDRIKPTVKRGTTASLVASPRERTRTTRIETSAITERTTRSARSARGLKRTRKHKTKKSKTSKKSKRRKSKYNKKN